MHKRLRHHLPLLDPTFCPHGTGASIRCIHFAEVKQFLAA